MKIRIKQPNIYSWDEINLERTKTECDEYFDEEMFNYESKPLVITDFEIGKNTRGQMVIDFESKNHKYFNIWDGMGWLSWDDNPINEEESNFGSRFVHMESQTKIVPKEGAVDWPVALWETKMIISPESEEEKELLGDRVSVLPLKYQYALTFLRWKDYNIDKLSKDSLDEGEEFKLEDTVYLFDI